MQRSTFDLQDTSWISPSQTLRPAERECAQKIESWPTPGELFFEAGIVLTVALGAGVAIQLIMGAA